MRLLLDTHVFIWLNDAPERLSQPALAACEDRDNTLMLNIVSPWEMQIKSALGKLELRTAIQAMCAFQMQVNDLKILPISLQHIARLGDLPTHHRDPFDRLLIAQAIEEGLTLVSSDAQFHRYGVPCLW